MKKIITTGQRYKSIKTGLSTAAKYPDRPMREANQIPLRERAVQHAIAHPNDKNTPIEDKSIQWAKSRQTKQEKKLKEFYKTHVYTWVSGTNRAWVSIAKGEEE